MWSNECTNMFEAFDLSLKYHSTLTLWGNPCTVNYVYLYMNTLVNSTHTNDLRMHAHAHTRTHTCTHTHACTYTHAPTHTHTHTHTQM